MKSNLGLSTFYRNLLNGSCRHLLSLFLVLILVPVFQFAAATTNTAPASQKIQFDPISFQLVPKETPLHTSLESTRIVRVYKAKSEAYTIFFQDFVAQSAMSVLNRVREAKADPNLLTSKKFGKDTLFIFPSQGGLMAYSTRGGSLRVQLTNATPAKLNELSQRLGLE